MDALKKELEEELKTSTEDLRSHAWYHGPVSREVSTEPRWATIPRSSTGFSPAVGPRLECCRISSAAVSSSISLAFFLRQYPHFHLYNCKIFVADSSHSRHSQMLTETRKQTHTRTMQAHIRSCTMHSQIWSLLWLCVFI